MKRIRKSSRTEDTSAPPKDRSSCLPGSAGARLPSSRFRRNDPPDRIFFFPCPQAQQRIRLFLYSPPQPDTFRHRRKA